MCAGVSISHHLIYIIAFFCSFIAVGVILVSYNFQLEPRALTTEKDQAGDKRKKLNRFIYPGGEEPGIVRIVRGWQEVNTGFPNDCFVSE